MLKNKRSFYRLGIATLTLLTLATTGGTGVASISKPAPVQARAINDAGLDYRIPIVYLEYNPSAINPANGQFGAYVVNVAIVNEKWSANVRSQQSMFNAEERDGIDVQAEQQAEKQNTALAKNSRSYDMAQIAQYPMIIMNRKRTNLYTPQLGSKARRANDWKSASQMITPFDIWFKYYAGLKPRELQAKLAIIQHESNGNWKVKGAHGAYGRFQLEPKLLKFGRTFTGQEEAMQHLVNRQYHGSWITAEHKLVK